MRNVWTSILLLGCFTTMSQSLPLGLWRIFPSFNRIHSVAYLPNTLYAAADIGLIAVTQNNIETLTLPLLGSTGIRALAAHTANNQLLIGYETGQLDILQNKAIFKYTTIRNNTQITGPKAIHHILIHNSNAYLATAFGVVVFDLNQREIRETWRNLGPQGETYTVYQAAIKDDSIFLATEGGIQGGSLQDNLLDFTRWKRFNQGTFNRPFSSLVSFNGFLFTAIPNDGLYRYDGLIWQRQDYLINQSTYHLFASNTHLYVTTANQLYRISPGGVPEEITSSLMTHPLCVTETPAGLAVGDEKNGLLTETGTVWQSLLPNGPTTDRMFRLRLDDIRKRLYALSGGYTSLFAPSGTEQPVNYYQLNGWNTQPLWLSRDVTDVAFTGNKVCIGSFSMGLQVITPDGSFDFNSGNSPLTGNRITALAAEGPNVWIANYNSAQPLHRLNADNTFTSFSFPLTAARYPLDLLVDRHGSIWMRLNPATGGGLLVFNPATSQQAYLNEITGSGGLPSRQVYSITSDRNGWVWVGTDAGVAYFPNPEQVFSGNINAVKPVFEGRFLLRDEKVTALAIDGGNRKWFGTQQGVWLFNATASTLLQYFNTSNSALPSNNIQNLAVDDSGHVWIATSQGLAVYRSDVSEPAGTEAVIKIFPNPVPPTFTGWVGISGLPESSTVRITDLAGKLIWQAVSNGGTAAWNVRDYNGQRPPAGIYLVFAISANGEETLAGKLALIN